MEALMSVCSKGSSVKVAIDMNFEKLKKTYLETREVTTTEQYIRWHDSSEVEYGSIKHKFRTAGEDGVLPGKQLSEYVKSARSVPPFPFMKENLLVSDDDKNKLSNVWAFSRSIKIRRNEEDDASAICAMCESHFLVFDTLLHCSICVTAVIHESCIPTHNTGWHQDENEIICKGCIYLSNAVDT